jgi:hypothetical protein
VGEYLKNNHFIRIELTTYHKIEELIYYITDNRTPRHPGTPLEQKMDNFGRPRGGGEGNYFQLFP